MIHEVKLNGGTVELKANVKDVIKLEGVKEVFFNGFKISTVSSKDSTVFYVAKEGLYYTDGGAISVYLVGQTSEFHDLREVLGLDYNFPDNYVTFKDLEDFSGGSEFDPTQYYTRTETDTKYQPKGAYATSSSVSTLEGKVSTLEGKVATLESDNSQLKLNLKALADRVTALEGAGA